MHTELCCETKTTKIVLTVFSIIVLIISFAHFAYAGLYGTLLDYYGDSFFNLDKSLFQKLYAPPLAYFVIFGIIQFLITSLYLLFLWQFIAKTKRRLGTMISLLIFEFGFNFAIAVWTSVLWTYYDTIWKTYLSWSNDYLNTLHYKWRDFHRTTVSTYRLTGAESIIAFLLVLPIITIQIYLIMDKYIDFSSFEDNHKKVHHQTSDDIKIQDKI